MNIDPTDHAAFLLYETFSRLNRLNYPVQIRYKDGGVAQRATFETLKEARDHDDTAIVDAALHFIEDFHRPMMTRIERLLDEANHALFFGEKETAIEKVETAADYAERLGCHELFEPLITAVEATEETTPIRRESKLVGQ
ncbi:MAG: hypothetical protein ACQERR_05705 [Pseudomonadota bacterium]